jgi:hypothetical protein
VLRPWMQLIAGCVDQEQAPPPWSCLGSALSQSHLMCARGTLGRPSTLYRTAAPHPSATIRSVDANCANGVEASPSIMRTCECLLRPTDRPNLSVRHRPVHYRSASGAAIRNAVIRWLGSILRRRSFSAETRHRVTGRSPRFKRHSREADGAPGTPARRRRRDGAESVRSRHGR